jgi:hypothetical protein
VIGAVAGASGQTRIRFTSLSPELKAWVQQTAARLGPAQGEPIRQNLPVEKAAGLDTMRT